MTPPNPWTRPVRTKVPAPTALFWFSTLLAGCLGTSVVQYLRGPAGLDLPSTTAVLSLLVVAALLGQLASARHVPATYWLVVVLLDGAGVAYQQALLVDTGVGPWPAALIPVCALAVVLVGWHRSEGEVAMDSIRTRRREMWFWGAALIATAGGAAVDNLLADRLGLTPPLSMLILAGLVGCVGLVGLLEAARRMAVLGAAVGFWGAYVLVRPVGAAVVDLLSDPPHRGGLGLGGGDRAALLILLLLVTVSAAALRARATSGGLSPAPGQAGQGPGSR